MEANKILQSDVLDILFENRNKTYGAYELRRTYNKRVAYAFAGMSILCGVFIAASIFAGSKKTTTDKPMYVKDVSLSKAEIEKPQDKIEVVQPKPKPIASVKFVVPKIVPPDQVKPEDLAPNNADLDDVHIGPVTTDGDKGDFVQPPVETGTGKVETVGKKEDDYNDIFTTVQIEAKFPGGFGEWEKFLQRNLRAEIPSENGANSGTYTVIVSFVVYKDGTINDVKAENDPGYGTAEEAVRVIKKSGQWIPAVQNGRNVIYRQRQKISFIVQDGN